MLRRIARHWIPRPLRERLRGAAARLRHRGADRHCPLCDARLARFLPHPTGRDDATCPVCDAQERHRAIWPFLIEQTPLAKGALRVLHVAPERCFERLLRELPDLDYVTMDLADERADVRADLTNLIFDDASFDLVICNHVLEHVPDDRAAMSEMFRVLRPGGAAVITVPGPPRERAQTEEDPAAPPEERRRRFGHPGHVRRYGRDLEDRLQQAGFAVDYVEVGRELPESERTRQGLFPFYPVYHCRVF